MQYQSQFQKLMSFLFFFTFFFALSFFVFSFYLYRWLKKTEQQNPIQQIQKQNQSDPLEFERSFSETQGMNHQNDENNSTQLSNSAHSLLLEILSSHSSKLTNLFRSEEGGDPDSNGSALGRKMNESSGDQKGKKKKKRKTKKKTSNSNCEERCVEEKGNLGPGSRAKQDLVCLYPFTSSSSATQKKIKLQYDELVKSHESKGLTLAQVGQFVNCLVEARNELQHKADVIQRKFTITKALLYKADRSSFDRLRQQIYKLEFEQKRLEDDAFVYNWLQQQLKLSPAYKKMLEIGECTELKSKAGELKQNTDSEFSEITFEELLAQEKKDSFWQRNGKIRSCSN